MPSQEPRRSTRGAGPPPLPPHFTTIQAILNAEVSLGSLVSVIGVVKECQLPVPTTGRDFKSTLKLVDLSVQDDEDQALNVFIFRQEAAMPKVSLGDVVLLWRVKVQQYRAYPRSVITNIATAIRVYQAGLIPEPPALAQKALADLDRDKHAPSTEANAYVSYLYHQLDKSTLPDEAEFRQRAEESRNVKQKFSLLKDVREGQFCDLIARVARPPFSNFGTVTLYVSDYTENPHFHNHTLEEMPAPDGDPYGYGYTGEPANVPKLDWVGPYGKMSLQVTCFEPHASYVQENVSAGDWVALRNVQIKYGRDGRFLEGFLRESFNYTTRINVNVLNAEDLEHADPRLKDAIRRRRDYEKKKQKQLKQLKAAQVAGEKRRESLAAGEKRKDSPTPEPERLNTKKRRKAARAAKKQQEEVAAAAAAAAAAATTTTTGAKEQPNDPSSTDDPPLKLELNEHVTCETHKAPFASITSILNLPIYPTTGHPLPFACTKHRVRVRVVDFFPHNLQDFACSRTLAEWDQLSDNGDLSDSASLSSSSSNNAAACDGVQGAKTVWEWRFALLLEDADPVVAKNTTEQSPEATRPSRLWALVDNTEAQCLTGLDATNLRRDPKTLERLRERMFTLWGNLETVKRQTQTAGSRSAEGIRTRKQHKALQQQQQQQQQQQPPKDSKKASLRRRAGLEKPPLESSDVSSEEDEEENEKNEEAGRGKERSIEKLDESKISNRPFACCIKQYGVRAKNGEGTVTTWVRCFGLFGTKICS
ncbi:hypothetical protein VTJ83DRAFT_5616 [Remersonia thermophila]|uniref:Protection of telomeres protein 1 n=1 Tax=Remersonia thermophila TaxID=72144 RepID=A0ABR4D9J2_9PEZI